MSDQWIPTPASGEGGRLPTEADERDDGEVYAQRREGGYRDKFPGQYVRDWPDEFVAWMPLPAPYVPPEKPERDDIWIRVAKSTGAILDAHRSPPYVSIPGDATTFLRYRRVLDGDCDPDGARQVLEEMNTALNSLVGRAECQRWRELLKGGDA